MRPLQLFTMFIFAAALAGGTASAGSSDAIDNAQKQVDESQRRLENRLQANKQRQYVDQQLWLLRQERMRAANRPSQMPLNVPKFQSTPRQ